MPALSCSGLLAHISLFPAAATPLCRRCCRCISAVGGQGGWAARSKASLLLALVIKRSGAELWEAALPQLLAAAAEGPALQVGSSSTAKALHPMAFPAALHRGGSSAAYIGEEPSRQFCSGLPWCLGWLRQSSAWEHCSTNHLHMLPPSQEEVCMVMKYVADEVTQYADDIQVGLVEVLGCSA